MKTLILLLSLFCLNVQADPPTHIRTLDGRDYTQVRIVRATDNGLRIIHADGAATLRFENLPEDIRKTYGYDPGKAAAADAAQLQADQQAAAAEAKAQAATAATSDRKQAALAALKKLNFGGPGYWDSPGQVRLSRDRSARRSLTAAGHTDQEADAIIASMKATGKSQPAPAKDPAFSGPQGQLRPAPAGLFKK
jgi:hypothetical protein